MKKIRAGLLLLITTFFWGVTFTIVKDAVSQVDVFVFLSQRFLIAAGLMLPFALFRAHRVSRQLLIHGIVLGTFLFAAYAFQTVALTCTSASNAGFLTGLNVVLVPLFGALLFRTPVGRNIKWGVWLAVPGLFLLSTDGSLSFNAGDLLATICGGCVALHMVFTGRFARHEGSDVFLLTALQLGTVGLLSLAAATTRGQKVLVWYPGIFWTLVVCVLIATIFAFLVQTSMQRHISPSHTALIFCTEPVFAALYAYFAAGERLGVFGFLGAVLIFAGMLVSELLPDQPRAEESVTVPAEG